MVLKKDAAKSTSIFMTTILIAITMLLFAMPWFFPIVYIGLFGLLYLIGSSLRWGLRGGLAAAFWASVVVYIAYVLQGGILINTLVSLLVYLIIGVGVGLNSDMYKKQQDSIRKSEEKIIITNKNLVTILENTLFGVAIIDKSRIIRWVSPVTCKIAGVESAEELIGKRCGEYLCPAGQNECPIIDKGQKVDNSERILCRRDGQIIPILKTVTEIEFEGEEVLLETFIDITDRKKAEQALLESETMFRSMAHNIEEVFWMRSADNKKMLYINPAYEKVWGRSCRSLYDHPDSFTESIHDEDRPRIMHAFAREMVSGGIFSEEYRITRPDGQIRWVYARTFPVKDENGTIVNYTGMAVDITDRKNAEMSVQSRENFLNTILQTSIDGFWVIDNQGRLAMVNDAYCSMTGYNREEIIGLSIGDLDAEESQSETAARVERIIKNGSERFETHHRRKDGSVFSVEVSTTFLPENGGQLVCFCRDTTERQIAEKARANRLAFEKLISGVSSYFVNLAPECIDDGINYALKAVGEYFGVDRSYLFRFSGDGRFMDNTHEWCAAGIESQYEENRQQLVEDFPWWTEQIRSCDRVYIPDIEAMPPEAAAEKAEFIAEGIRTILCVPIIRDDLVFGFFGFDSVHDKREWTEDQVALIKVFAELFSNAMVRNQNDEIIRRLSFHDQLTGLYNRHYFASELERLKGSREYPIAIISADLDGLKQINDTLGHAKGDLYLKSGATLLKKCLRSSDLLARVGGDEFALILPHTSWEEGNKLISRIYCQVEEHNLALGGMPLSISLGLAVSNSEAQTLEETYRVADALMYEDKLARKKRYLG